MGQPRRVSSLRSHSAARSAVGGMGWESTDTGNAKEAGELFEQALLLACHEVGIHGTIKGYTGLADTARGKA